MDSPRRFVAVVAVGLLSSAFCVLPTLPSQAQSPSPTRSPAEPALQKAAPPADSTPTVIIPGPLRSFMRMAGISQATSPEDVLPLLARNVFLHGHTGSQETEFLVLLDRYVKFARELESFAGPDGTIRVANCGEAANLVHTLGYKFERGCSSQSADLTTENAERAFLTVDSGFPLTDLEESLRNGTGFSYAFPATAVPTLFTEKDWMVASAWKQKNGETLLDLLLHDSDADRLYSAMERCDQQTRLALFHSPGLKRLMSVAAAFDFYGGRISIRSGAVVIPAGATAGKDWQELVGASPQSAGDFVARLLSRDRGWLAAYFDAVSRISPAQQTHLAEGDRTKRLYEAYRSAPSTANAASGIFPRNTELLLLLTRVQWQANGDPQVPGNIAVWQEALTHESKAYQRALWTKHVPAIQTPNQLLEEMVRASSSDGAISPSEIYLSLSAIDAARPAGAQLPATTARLLTANFYQFSSWYPIFVEFPALDNDAINDFLNTANRMAGISDAALRSNTLGTFQAELGLWQILARQKEIRADGLNTTWRNIIKPYASVNSSQQLFDAARVGLRTMVSATNQSTAVQTAASANPPAARSANQAEDPTEDQILGLLAGPPSTLASDQHVRQALADRMRAVLDDQRLVSLDTLFGLYDGLDALAHGQPVGDTLLTLAGDLREFEMPRPIFTGGEKAAWSPIVYTSRHAELQVRTDLTKIIKTPGSAAQLEAARGRLTPFLRDTLVGLNYAYYEPPGAEVLHNNPLFVRSHDFTDTSIEGVQQIWGAPVLVGIGVTAGGGAYLMGSLADLPYALAATEEDFIAPENVQALIWREMVPELLVGATLPRWWGIGKNELHAAALYQRAGEELLLASAHNDQLREKVLGILSTSMPSAQLEQMESDLEHPESAARVPAEILPAGAFHLESEFRRRFPGQAALVGPSNRELDDLIQKDPSETSPARLSADFGMPHPTMADSDSLSLLNTEPFPVSSGVSSRLFSESWDSDNLYWARLADEMNYSPAMLNLLAPELTRRMIANLFASNIDDWSALLRAMEETGSQFKQGKIPIASAVTIAGNGSATDGSVHNNE